jgi:two-component system, NarL family, nitrate/nitrite response regulator NarL
MRILVVSDVRVVQQGLSAILGERTDIEVVGTTEVHCARDRCLELGPDVVLFDAARREHLTDAADLVASALPSKVVAFGVKETEEEVLALAAAGTAGYVRDNAACDDLVTVLERVICDELPCSARAAALLYHRVAVLSQASDDPWPAENRDTCTLPLSRRELEIVQLIDCGLTNKQIARQLGIEASTVKNHVHNVCEKLQVHRRGEAVAQIRARLRTPRPLAAGGESASRYQPAGRT